MGWDVVGSVRDAAGWASDKVNGALDGAGHAIDSAVHSAEHATDDARHAIVDFGERHGGVVGQAIAKNVSDSIGVVEGAGLAVYDAGAGVATLARGAGALANPVEWIAHPEQNMARLTTTGNSLTAMAKLGSPIEWAMHPTENGHAAQALWNGVTAGYQDAARSGDWSKFAGRAVVDVGSMFIGVGEANAAIKTAEGANALAHLGEAANGLAHGGEALAALGRGAEVAGDVARSAETGAALAREAEALTQVTSSVGKNSVTWTVDAQGRTVRAEAELQEVFSGAARSSAERNAQAAAGAAGEVDDVGGHIIGHRFVKDQGEVNLFPQNTQFNNSAYRKLENEWGDWVQHGNVVDVDVSLRGGTAVRPGEVVVSYTVRDAAGEVVHQDLARFANEAGQQFDRVPRSDMPR
jgi:DNA/RNA non-specific endonuclease